MPASFRSTREVLIDIGIAFLCILPLLLTSHLPLSDAPNHLARQFILRDLADSPQLQQYYAVHWALVPNLALELFMACARLVVPLPMAMRLFCILTVLLLFLGTRAVNRTMSDGTSRAYRAVPLLCWGGPMQYGFLGYCFGIGLGLILFNTWLHLRERDLTMRVIFLLAAGTILMLCHLAAFGLFAIAVGVCELLDRQRILRILPPVLSLTAIFAIFTLFSPTAETAGSYGVQFSGWHDKIRSFAAIVFFSAPKLEGALLAAGIIGLVAALLTRTVRWDRLGLSITAVMALVWLLTPNYALDVDYIDYRLPWAVSFFAVAGLRPGVASHALPGQRAWARSLTIWFGLLGVARIAMIAVFWLRWEPTIDGIDRALAELPNGARIMTVVGEPGPKRGFRDPDLSNVASFAVIRRQAFEPGIFASIPGQILHLQPHYRDLARQDGFPETPKAKLDSLAPEYQYVLVLAPSFAELSPAVTQKLTMQAEGPLFQLFKVGSPADLFKNLR